MRRVADLYPCETKADAKDAVVIAAAVRIMPQPHRLRSLALPDEITAELSVLNGLWPGPRRRSHPHQRPDTRPVHPVPRMTASGSWVYGRTTLPSPGSSSATDPGRTAQGRPPQTRRADPAQGSVHGHPADRGRLRRPRRADRSGSGNGHLGVVIPSPARSLAAVHEQRRVLEARIGTLPVLASMPGVGVTTAAVLLVTLGDGMASPVPPTSLPTPASLPRPGRR